jgi:hypothetical protein
MSLPSGISTCVVTFGRATSYLGIDATISGTLSADRSIVHAATGVRIGSGDDIVPNDAGFLSFLVPHVNQSGFTDASGGAVVGWLYKLAGTIRYASGKTEPFSRTFQVLVGQTTVDLDLVPDGPVMPGFTAPAGTVTSVAGKTGAITSADLANDFVPVASRPNPNEDLNEATAFGVYAIGGLESNTPVSDIPGVLLVASAGGMTALQLAAFSDGSTWSRSRAGTGDWGGWAPLVPFP